MQVQLHSTQENIGKYMQHVQMVWNLCQSFDRENWPLERCCSMAIKKKKKPIVWYVCASLSAAPSQSYYDIAINNIRTESNKIS